MSQSDFTKPYLILVEGAGDAAFFRHVIKARTIPDDFDVRCPRDGKNVNGSGNTRFREALDAFAIIPGFDKLRGILIVTDNDEDPMASFKNVQDQIRNTSRKHSAPTQPLAKTSGFPAFVVMTIPWINELGNLETLCIQAAEFADPTLATCADTFQVCTGVDQWTLSKRSKVKLRSIISAGYRRNADESLSFLWNDYPGLIPLNHKCFDKIAVFLTNFGKLITTP